MNFDNLTMAEYFHLLVNVEDHPDFLPKGRELATGFLAAADYAAHPHYAKFEYSLEPFDARMDRIYDDSVAGMDRPHWLDRGGFSDAAVVENLRQWAPFNLVDGAWLQRILNTGPCNEVQANLFAIWVDEAGNGRTELNHCNVYDTLLRSVNVYLPPITSHEFIEQDFLPSAFTSSVFQMCVGLFPQDFLPELLGMTLFLEWESTPVLAPTVRMLAGRRIDPHFYRLHVAIDNVASGHGALAKRAIKLFLDDAADRGGDAAVQAQWARIWNGYVTWATTGTFGSDLGRHLQLFDGKIPSERKAYAKQRMVELISRKAPTAKKSHGRARLGGRRLNELFATPEALMDALLDDPQGWMDIENPRNSRFLRELVSFTGPMYKVFTEEDIEIVLDWLDSMRDDAPGPTTPTPVLLVGDQMKGVLVKYADRGQHLTEHAAFTFPQVDGTPKPITEWFEGLPEEMMAAMARSQFVTPGSVDRSSFFTQVVGAQGFMAAILDPADEQVIQRWVAAGCPMPGDAVHPASAPGPELIAEIFDGGEPPPPAEVPFSTRRLSIGQGGIH